MKKNKQIKITTITSEEIFHKTKDRYNPYGIRTGVNETAKDKAKNRNSKYSKKLKQSLKKYCN